MMPLEYKLKFFWSDSDDSKNDSFRHHKKSSESTIYESNYALNADPKL